MFTDQSTFLFCILTIFVIKSLSCTDETYWRTFVYTEPVTFNYYRKIPSSSVSRCTMTCWRLYDLDQIYFQGEDCYCLAPVYEKAGLVSGTVMTNSSIWTIYQDTNYCTEKGYKIFPDQRYCLKFFALRKPWDAANSRCRQDGGYLISVYTQQDYDNFRSLYTLTTPVYVGAHRTQEGTELDWITGETVNESFWGPGEPNNDSGNEDCVAVLDNGDFNDKPCDYIDSYVCQLLTF